MWEYGLAHISCSTRMLGKKEWELADCYLFQSMGDLQHYNQSSGSWLEKELWTYLRICLPFNASSTKSRTGSKVQLFQSLKKRKKKQSFSLIWESLKIKNRWFRYQRLDNSWYFLRHWWLCSNVSFQTTYLNDIKDTLFHLQKKLQNIFQVLCKWFIVGLPRQPCT